MANTSDPKKNTQPQSSDLDNTAEDEQRKNKRVDFFTPVKVVVPSDNTSIDVFAANVSKGGMFIRSNQPLAPGKKIRMSFSTEKGSVHVDEAEVRWAKRFEPISVDGSPPGMGVEFKRLSDDSMENIGAFIDEILGQDSPMASVAKSPEPITEPALPVIAPIESHAKTPLEISDSSQTPEAAQMQIPPSETSTPTPTKEWDQGSEEDMAAAFSTPPPTRTRMLLFAGFVLIVAVLTFLTLMWLKPFGSSSQKATLTPVRHAKNKPTTDSDLASKTEPSKELKKPAKEQGGQQKDSEENNSTKPQVQEPKLKKSHEKIAATDTAKETDVHKPQISSPLFSKTESGWQMSIGANSSIHSKHFGLKSPPRLAIDIMGAKWLGKSQMDHPAPFVSRIRIGKQPDHVRFVLDFKTDGIPKYKVEKKEKSLLVLFPGIK